jgi:RHH-type proline utilization regulon transcriptional repressor/proline dehydrogenase/delta 1-pyrroline-5-carboxylate dehydrogenase
MTVHAAPSSVAHPDPGHPDPDRRPLRAALLRTEPQAVADAIADAALSDADRAAIAARGAGLVRAVREGADPGAMEAMLAEFGLSTREGVALMCLAEALLRTPDAPTVDALIEDKIAPHDWGAHLGDSGSVLVNASTWALMLTGRVLEPGADGVAGALRGLVRRVGEPVIRRAVAAAMRAMGAQFVLGQTMPEALKRGGAMMAKGYGYSFDMLGEAARTEADARRYLDAYAAAIRAVAPLAKGAVRDNPGISVKLSALHPRYEAAQMDRAGPELADRLGRLARLAAEAGVGLNVDAEEADRLEPSFDVIARVAADPALKGWQGFGVVVQAYGLRCAAAIDWLDALAAAHGRRMMVRLVKGAYWDAEVKRAQVMGLDRFPVFTRKAHTDVAWIGAARRLLGARNLYPQFATHNAHSAAAVLAMAGTDRQGWEFQRLHGMGEALHETLMREEGARCRIYAPVGAHRDLLAYLVRRLLENGANSSFVHQIVDADVAPEVVAADPFAAASGRPHPAVTPPAALFAPRANSRGADLADPVEWAAFAAARAPYAAPHRWGAGPRAVTNPADPGDVVGHVRDCAPAEAPAAVDAAMAAAPGWAATPAAARAAVLRRAADAFEGQAGELTALLAREAGKTAADAVAELREAVDFLRYYADGAAAAEAGTQARGVAVCISPWNFPLAIFTGQVAAALAAGNAVAAKPAEQTPLIAARAVELLHGAGVPADVLRLVQGDGAVGAALTAHPGLGAVMFTGSTEVARLIERQLARTAPGALLVAETGGLNAMIVDSTALPEQAVRDAVAGAFQSAGQRCSALRVLYAQDQIAPALTAMLTGAMAELRIGNPWDRATDVGPVIDAQAQADVAGYVAQARAEGRVVAELPAPDGGCFVGPTVIRVRGIEDMPREVFGPVLHLATFPSGGALDVVRAVNARGYGLTMGLHTRIDARVQQVIDAARVGNLYVNRNQIGAVVGSQPFGGEGLSGAGPKAGGPHLLRRLRKVEASAVPAVDAPAADPAALGALRDGLDGAAWAARPDRIPALRAALRGRAAAAMAQAAAVETGPVDLPGPTGEANQLRLAPRGAALCLGPTAEAALDQAVRALAMGCPAVLCAPGATAAAATLRAASLPVAALDAAPPHTLDPRGFDALGWDGPRDEAAGAALRRMLADREGPLVPIIGAGDPVEAWAVERVVSVDVTAAGGDAALLARVG